MIGGSVGLIAALFSVSCDPLAFLPIGMLEGWSGASVCFVIILARLSPLEICRTGILHLAHDRRWREAAVATTFRVLFCDRINDPLVIVPICGGVVAGVWES